MACCSTAAARVMPSITVCACGRDVDLFLHVLLCCLPASQRFPISLALASLWFPSAWALLPFNSRLECLGHRYVWFGTPHTRSRCRAKVSAPVPSWYHPCVGFAVAIGHAGYTLVRCAVACIAAQVCCWQAHLRLAVLALLVCAGELMMWARRRSTKTQWASCGASRRCA
jgi:hypothetical protein